VAEREASGEFDYLVGDLTEADWSDGDDALPEPVPPEEFDYALRDDDQWDDPDDGFWSNEAEPERNGSSFDAFDANTWYFEPAPPPWYRTKRVLTALIASVAAAAALVVSAVLLVFRSPSTTVEDSPSVAPTAQTTAQSTQPETSAPPPPPPPTETSASPIDPGPAQTYQPRNPPRTTKEPEIGVTRTPVTRSPISVSPQRPGSRN
jgi:hypothetical protein